jgi:hypothetical protein
MMGLALAFKLTLSAQETLTQAEIPAPRCVFPSW